MYLRSKICDPQAPFSFLLKIDRADKHSHFIRYFYFMFHMSCFYFICSCVLFHWEVSYVILHIFVYWILMVFVTCSSIIVFYRPGLFNLVICWPFSDSFFVFLMILLFSHDFSTDMVTRPRTISAQAPKSFVAGRRML